MTKKAFSITAAGALAITALTPAITTEAAVVYADDLVISEYVEGSSNNKAIEIYNGTGAPVDLSAYSIELYANLNTTPGNTITLSGTLAHGETKVFVHNQANDVLKPLGEAANVTNFNGDDTVVLKKNDTIIDSFGKIAGGEKFAENVTYVRNADNFTGDTNPNDDIDLSGWTQYPIDTFSDLGKHTANHGVALAEGSISIADVLAAELDTEVQTEGTIVGIARNTAHIFDGEKAIAIHHKDAVGEAKVGDYVVVKGKRAVYNGLAQVGSAELVTLKEGTSTPTPRTISPENVGEAYESQLVTVENITIAEDATGTNKAVVGQNFVVRDELATGVTAGTTYDSITGIVVEFNGTYQIVPRSADDLVANVPPAPLETETIAAVRERLDGPAQVQGVITAIIGQTIHIQDETGAIVLYGSLDVAVGDEVVVKGSLTEYSNLLEITGIEVVERIGTADVPAPKLVTAAQITEDIEAQLVQFSEVTVSSYSGGNYTVTDAAGDTFLIRDTAQAMGLEIGKTYDQIIGVVQQYGENYQIFIRSTADVIEDLSVVQAVTASATNLVTVGTEVTLSTTTPDATIYYTTDGSEPTTASTKYEGPITINEAQTVKAIAVKEGLTPSIVSTFTYDVFDGTLKIHHIQGEAHTSPFKGQQVTDIEGVVTYLFKIRSSHYATIQTPDSLIDDNPNTSEGILVFLGNSYGDVAVGDQIKVSGVVDEYRVEGNEGDLLSTQINARNGKIEKVASGVALPSAITVDETTIPRDVIDNDSFAQFDPEEDAIDYWESLEGMRVAFSGLKATSPQEYGDITTVLETRETDTNNGGVLISATDYNADRIHLKAFKANGDAATDFDVSTGDTFKGEAPIIGVVGYGFSNYKIYLDEADLREVYEAGNIQPEATTIVKDPTKLTIANYNIENFSANTSETSDAKAKLIAQSFVTNMQSPDIIGIVEMQDNNGETADGNSAANESYQRLINAIVEAGGPRYEYVNIDPVYNQDGGAPGANIRPGFLYNPERVTLKEGTPGDATTAVTYENGALSHNPGLVNPTDEAFASSRKPIAAQFTFNGEDVLVIGNHFNSKGGDTALFGATQPPVLGSEVQRKKIAEQVKAFVESVKADNPQANVVALGDFNDFEFSAPLEILEQAGLVNMIKRLPKEDRYTYTYQGNSQVLDHILVSDHLADATEVDALHINADYSSVSGKRASDHDPVLVQIDLTKELVEMPELVPFTLKGKQTGKLVLTKSKLDVYVEEGYTIKNGIVIKGHKDGSYIRLAGALADQVVTIEAKQDAPVVIDFAGATVKEVIITGDYAHNVVLHNTQNVQAGIE